MATETARTLADIFTRLILGGTMIFNWTDIWKEVLAGTLIFIISLIITYMIGIVNGKKKSADAITRKNDIYLPLHDEIELVLENINVFENNRLKFASEVMVNNYKYGLDESIITKIDILNELICSFDKINLVNIAHNVIVDHFEFGFTNLFGSIVDGISYNVSPEGYEYETENYVEEFESIKFLSSPDLIIPLLKSEGMPTYSLYDNDGYEYATLYDDLVRIYSIAMNTKVNGIKVPNRKRIINWDKSAAEYFAYNSEFFNDFNNNEQTKKKYLMKDNILVLAREIIEDLEIIIKKIVLQYEKEQI